MSLRFSLRFFRFGLVGGLLIAWCAPQAVTAAVEEEIGQPVKASQTKLGTIVDLSKLLDQTVAHYTSDAGNHASIQISPIFWFCLR